MYPNESLSGFDRPLDEALAVPVRDVREMREVDCSREDDWGEISMSTEAS